MIEKSFDEMTGKGEITTSAFRVDEHKMWLLPTSYLEVTPSVVVAENGEKFFWMVFNSYYSDWKFLDDPVMFALVDGVRLRVEGIVTYSDTTFDRDELMCVEIAQMEVDPLWLETLSQSKEAKIRVIGIDFEVSPAMKTDIEALLHEMRQL